MLPANSILSDLIGNDQELLRSYEIFRTANDIYMRSMAVINPRQRVALISADTKSIEVVNDAAGSTKIS